MGMSKMITSELIRLIFSRQSIELNNSYESLLGNSNTSIIDDTQEINTHRSNNSKSSDRIILFNVNCRSLRSESKREEYLALVDMYKPHIIHATETHLAKQISNAELIDPLLYDIYRKDRLFDPGHECGGVLNAIRKDVISSG